MKPPIKTLAPCEAEKLLKDIAKGNSLLIIGGVTNLYEDSAAIIAAFPGKIILNELTRMSESAALLLQAHKGGLSLMNLRDISDELAEALVGYQGELNLPLDINQPALLSKAFAKLILRINDKQVELCINQATEISWEAAQVLAGFRGKLYLNGVNNLSLPSAIMPEKTNGDLCPNAIDGLTEMAASALATHHGELYLNGLSNLDEVVAAALVNHDGLVSLTGVKNISSEVACLLANSGKNIKLSISQKLPDQVFNILSENYSLTPFELSNFDFTSLTPDSALFLLLIKQVREDKPNIDLNNLKFLCPETASVLSEYKGTMLLNGVNQLSLESAKFLGNHVGILSLDGLTEISDDVAEELSRHKGTIRLNGINCINDKSAYFLAKHQGGVSLDGLIEISESFATSFSEHQGPLSLNGLTYISDTAAKALAKRDGEYSLSGFEFIEELKVFTPGIALLCARLGYKNNLTELSADVVEALCSNWNHSVHRALSFPQIRSISYETALAFQRNNKCYISLSLLYINEKTLLALLESKYISEILCIPTSERAADALLEYYANNFKSYFGWQEYSGGSRLTPEKFKRVENAFLLYMKLILENDYLAYGDKTVKKFNADRIHVYFDAYSKIFPESSIYFKYIVDSIKDTIQNICYDDYDYAYDAGINESHHKQSMEDKAGLHEMEDPISEDVSIKDRIEDFDDWASYSEDQIDEI